MTLNKDAAFAESGSPKHCVLVFFLFFNEMVGPYRANTQWRISRSLMVKASDIFGFDKNIK